MSAHSEYDAAMHFYVFTADTAKEASSNANVHVDRSWIDESFLGLFASRKIVEGEQVCEYAGTVLRTAEAMHLEDKSYLMRLGNQCYVDSLHCPHCIARYINDCRNPAGVNVRFDKDPEAECARVVATRDIACGEELFVDYGKWYWAGCSIAPIRLGFGDLHRRRSSLPGYTLAS
jgi:SET domain-containing protein